MTYTCTRPGCEIKHEGQAYCPTCTAEIKQNLAEQRLAQGEAASCSCLPGACHGGHTTTRLSAVRAWMLAHDWTETSEGDSGWMWQHTSGRKVAVFRDLTDPHMWEGLIGRLAVAHARHPSDIEREIRGGDEPVCLADEQLRRITQYVHPDEKTEYVRPWLHSMAGELLAARDRITDLETVQRASHLEIRDLHLDLQRARLEAAGPKITSETSDGYHTFAELYRYRMLYNAALFNEWARAGLYDVHKSWRHSDGQKCFDGDWFVVYAQLPSGQISNHYEADAWEFFRIPEREVGAEWDGHTPEEVATRLAFMLRVEARTAARAATELESFGYAAEQHRLRLIAFVEDMTHRGDVPAPLREHATNLMQEVRA